MAAHLLAVLPQYSVDVSPVRDSLTSTPTTRVTTQGIATSWRPLSLRFFSARPKCDRQVEVSAKIPSLLSHQKQPIFTPDNQDGQSVV